MEINNWHMRIIGTHTPHTLHVMCYAILTGRVALYNGPYSLELDLFNCSCYNLCYLNLMKYIYFLLLK